MKKKMVLYLLLIGVLAKAQYKRFTYEYRFIPDSTNVSDIKTEIMNLDISDSGSQFYSYTSYHSDSIMKIDVEKQLASTGMIQIKANDRKGSVRYSVSKEYPNYDVYLHNRIFRDKYKISDNRKIEWKIGMETTKIGEWKVQKAETDFAGRHWIAWFTEEIPIQDGPYKFHGLPGLIVKLEDLGKSHVFNLQAVKNLKEIQKDVIDQKEILVKQKQYDKLVKEYENDPTKGLKEMQMGGVTMIMKEDTGHQMKDQEERLKARIRRDNNRIELITK